MPDNDNINKLLQNGLVLVLRYWMYLAILMMAYILANVFFGKVLLPDGILIALICSATLCFLSFLATLIYAIKYEE